MIHQAPVSNFKAAVLSDDELRGHAPSVFATGPMTGLSPRYTFVPTTEIVAGLREKHWVPVAVEQQHVRTTHRLGFQKHLIRFRLAEQMQTLDDWNVELVLTNSHDAGCAYILRVGVFRRLCSNGLVVGADSFESIRFRHAGLRAEEVVAASYRILESLPRVGTLIEQFRNREMTPAERVEFARRALLLRFDTVEQSPIEPATLLEVRRVEDIAHDLWTVLNRCQENLVRGGLSDVRRDRKGHLRSLRGLRGIDSKVSLNQALWGLAEATAGIRN